MRLYSSTKEGKDGGSWTARDGDYRASARGPEEQAAARVGTRRPRRGLKKGEKGADDGRRLGWLLGGMEVLVLLLASSTIPSPVTLDGPRNAPLPGFRGFAAQVPDGLYFVVPYAALLRTHLLEAAISRCRAAALIGPFRYSCLSLVLSLHPDARRKC